VRERRIVVTLAFLFWLQILTRKTRYSRQLNQPCLESLPSHDDDDNTTKKGRKIQQKTIRRIDEAKKFDRPLQIIHFPLTAWRSGRESEWMRKRERERERCSCCLSPLTFEFCSFCSCLPHPKGLLMLTEQLKTRAGHTSGQTRVQLFLFHGIYSHLVLKRKEKVHVNLDSTRGRGWEEDNKEPYNNMRKWSRDPFLITKKSERN